jgi:hypothetical protein
MFHILLSCDSQGSMECMYICMYVCNNHVLIIAHYKCTSDITSLTVKFSKHSLISKTLCSTKLLYKPFIIDFPFPSLQYRTIPWGHVKFKVGDLLCITKEKLQFATGYVQKFSTEIFHVVKAIKCTSQPVYKMTDLQSRLIEGQFYNYEHVKVTVITCGQAPNR